MLSQEQYIKLLEKAVLGKKLTYTDCKSIGQLHKIYPKIAPKMKIEINTTYSFSLEKNGETKQRLKFINGEEI